jgi:hypothetical protein
MTPSKQIEGALQELHEPRPHGRQVALAVLGLAMVLLALTLLKVTTTVSHNTAGVKATRQDVEANRQAILVACTLISRVVSQAGVAGGSGDRKDNSRPTPAQELNNLYLAVIIDHMTADERRKERRLRGLAGDLSTRVEVPDCQQVAQHPETVTSKEKP